MNGNYRNVKNRKIYITTLIFPIVGYYNRSNCNKMIHFICKLSDRILIRIYSHEKLLRRSRE